MTQQPINGDELLAKINPQLKEAREEVCLRPDLIDEWNELDTALKVETAKAAGAAGGRLVNAGPDKLPATPAAKRIAKQIGALEKKIEDTSIWFTFRALSRPDYEALCMEHPPRKDNQFDMLRGYNISAVADALVRRSLVDPVFTDEGWLELQRKMGEAEWNALVNGAETANSGVKKPGKSELASRIRSQRGNASA